MFVRFKSSKGEIGFATKSILILVGIAFSLFSMISMSDSIYGILLEKGII